MILATSIRIVKDGPCESQKYFELKYLLLCNNRFEQNIKDGSVNWLDFKFPMRIFETNGLTLSKRKDSLTGII
jgi:hypothetical protein